MPSRIVHCLNPIIHFWLFTEPLSIRNYFNLSTNEHLENVENRTTISILILFIHNKKNFKIDTIQLIRKIESSSCVADITKTELNEGLFVLQENSYNFLKIKWSRTWYLPTHNAKKKVSWMRNSQELYRFSTRQLFDATFMKIK